MAFERFRIRTCVIALAALVAAFALAGCGDKKPDGTESSNEPQKQRSAEDIATEKKNFREPPPVQILSGDDTGYRVKEPTVVVMNTQKAEDKVMKRHFSHGLKKQFIAGTLFKTRQVVALFMPRQPGGTLVILTDIYKDGDKLMVKGIRLLRGRNCPAPSRHPRPFHIVETNRLIADPVLQLKDQRASDC